MLGCSSITLRLQKYLVIHPLAQQLNWRLGKVLLPLWHVQVIHKNDIFLTCRRPKHTLHAQNNARLLLFAQGRLS